MSKRGYKSARDVLHEMREREVEFLDLKFVDLFGGLQHITFPADAIDEATFHRGVNFDGSSVRGFQSIHESDLLLRPDPASVFFDPFYEEPTLSVFCDVIDPRGHKLRALLFHPEGKSLLDGEREESVLQFALRSWEGFSQVEGLRIAVEVKESFVGPRRSLQRRRVETLLDSGSALCGNADDDNDDDDVACENAILELDLGKLRELLSFLYNSGPRPECIDAFDRNGDGRMALDDVVGWTRELIAR